MSAVIATEDEALLSAGEPLREQIDRVEAKLGGLTNDLRSLDGQLAELAPKREQFGLVQNVCDSLERLSELGVANIFWGDKADEIETERHVDEVLVGAHALHVRGAGLGVDGQHAVETRDVQPLGLGARARPEQVRCRLRQPYRRTPRDGAVAVQESLNGRLVGGRRIARDSSHTYTLDRDRGPRDRKGSRMNRSFT